METTRVWVVLTSLLFIIIHQQHEVKAQRSEVFPASTSLLSLQNEVQSQNKLKLSSSSSSSAAAAPAAPFPAFNFKRFQSNENVFTARPQAKSFNQKQQQQQQGFLFNFFQPRQQQQQPHQQGRQVNTFQQLHQINTNSLQEEEQGQFQPQILFGRKKPLQRSKPSPSFRFFQNFPGFPIESPTTRPNPVNRLSLFQARSLIPDYEDADEENSLLSGKIPPGFKVYDAVPEDHQ